MNGGRGPIAQLS